MPGPRRRPPNPPTQPAPPTPTAGAADNPQARAPDAFSGWADLRNAVNRHLPTQLERSQRSRQAILRVLAGKSKVRR